MKAVMVMFDSLNRHMLPPYNAGTFVHAPNFARLAQRATTFDRSTVCSMPCMPARRDLHTGRPNFLHGPWGPIEPFDDSMPQILRESGVHTHLCSDHYHYWEDGGATYHNRYSTWEFFRGQEGDPWIGRVGDPDVPPNINSSRKPQRSRQDWINRPFMDRERDLPQSRTHEAGAAFLDRNHDRDNWFLQIECFDPHEPFVSHRRYRDLYLSDYTGPLFDWPHYRKVTESPEEVAEARRNYAALLSKCDASLGDVLDRFDRHGLWDDTMLIVWTDHGFLLGEHDCWAKNWMPLYEEVSHTPFFVWDPRAGEAGGRRSALVQPSIDLAPTLLRYFGQQPTADMLGRDLAPVLERDAAVRDAAIFGYHGRHVNVTDGRYVYLRDSATQENTPLFRYTLMPTAMRSFENAQRLADATLAPPFPFTKGQPLLRIGVDPDLRRDDRRGTLLFDLENDPRQRTPLDDPAVEARMVEHMVRLMGACNAPGEQYERMGLPAPLDA